MKKILLFLLFTLTCSLVFSQHKRKQVPNRTNVRIDTVNNKIYHITDAFGDIKGTKKDTIKIYSYGDR